MPRAPTTCAREGRGGWFAAVGGWRLAVGGWGLNVRGWPWREADDARLHPPLHSTGGQWELDETVVTIPIKIAETKGAKHREEMETEFTETNIQTKRHAALASVSDGGAFPSNSESMEKLMHDVNEVVNILLSTYSETLSQRTAVNAKHVQQLTTILEEAKDMERYLKQKKEGLRHKLTMIANALQTE